MIDKKWKYRFLSESRQIPAIAYCQYITMQTHKSIILLLIFSTIIFCKPVFKNGKATHNKLLVISFDGFRWNYDQDVDTPLLDYLAEIGVKAKYVSPPFVTMTSPSHFTTITGKSRKPIEVFLLLLSFTKW